MIELVNENIEDFIKFKIGKGTTDSEKPEPYVDSEYTSIKRPRLRKREES